MSLFTQPPKSLCILRLSAIGDVCNALAAVQQIQRYWPNTQITWVIGKTEAQLLSSVKGINFVIYDKKAGWKGIWSLWRQLRNYHFDALLNMQTAIRASVLSLGIRATYKIGFGSTRAREGQWLFTNRRVTDPQKPHVLDGFLSFVEYLGIPIQQPTWDLNLSEDEQLKASQFIDSSRKNILISPCSSKAEKDWVIEHYAAIANFAHRHNINVILCGAPVEREKEIVKKIVNLCEFEPVNICGKTSLRELTALIGMVDLVIAPDSGPAHIATAQGTAVIGLYAYHNPLRTGPYNDLENVISVYEQNAQKEFGKPSTQLPWATKLKGKNLMSEIHPQPVITKMTTLLNIVDNKTKC